MQFKKFIPNLKLPSRGFFTLTSLNSGLHRVSQHAARNVLTVSDKNLQRREFGDRIRELRRQLNLAQKPFAQRLGVSQSTLSQIENGHHYPSFDSVARLVADFGVNANWLVTGLSRPFAVSPPVERRGTMAGITEKALAGYSANHRDELWLERAERYRLPGFETSVGGRIFQVLHDSMEPTLYDQDHVAAALIEDHAERHVGQVVVVVLADKVLAKRLAGYEPRLQRFSLASDNPKYKTIELGGADILELWLVTARLTRQLSPMIANQDYRLAQLEAAYQALTEKVEALTTS